MAIKRLHVGVGNRRQRTNPPYPSHPAYVQYMRESAALMAEAMLDVIDQFEEVTDDVMLDSLEPVLKKAEYYCPKDTLELVNSSYLEKANFRGQPRVEIGFAKGGNPDYAVYVHEIMDYKHEEPTQAKFLETAVMEDLDGIYERIGAGYRKFVGGGAG